MQKKEKKYRTKEEFMKELQSLTVIRGIIWILIFLYIVAMASWLLGQVLPEGWALREAIGSTSIEDLVLIQVGVLGAISSMLLTISKTQADIQKSIVEKLFESEQQRRADGFVRH